MIKIKKGDLIITGYHDNLAIAINTRSYIHIFGSMIFDLSTLDGDRKLNGISELFNYFFCEHYTRENKKYYNTSIKREAIRKFLEDEIKRLT